MKEEKNRASKVDESSLKIQAKTLVSSDSKLAENSSQDISQFRQQEFKPSQRIKVSALQTHYIRQ